MFLSHKVTFYLADESISHIVTLFDRIETLSYGLDFTSHIVALSRNCHFISFNCEYLNLDFISNNEEFISHTVSLYCTIRPYISHCDFMYQNLNLYLNGDFV